MNKRKINKKLALIMVIILCFTYAPIIPMSLNAEEITPLTDEIPDSVKAMLLTEKVILLKMQSLVLMELLFRMNMRKILKYQQI